MPLSRLGFRVSHFLRISPDFIEGVERAAFIGEDVFCALCPTELLQVARCGGSDSRKSQSPDHRRWDNCCAGCAWM